MFQNLSKRANDQSVVNHDTQSQASGCAISDLKYQLIVHRKRTLTDLKLTHMFLRFDLRETHSQKAG